METTPGIRCQRNNWMPVAALWDYDGSCLNWSSSATATVSVAVFQWVAKARPKGIHDCKRGKSVKRFSGSPGNKEAIFAKAEAYCKQMEASLST